jgi:hypothetical protein
MCVFGGPHRQFAACAQSVKISKCSGFQVQFKGFTTKDFQLTIQGLGFRVHSVV